MSRRVVCGILFWIKAIFALLFAFAILGFFSWRIYDLHKLAVAPKIDFGSSNGDSSNDLNPSVIPSPRPQCITKPSNLARLEPPAKILFGFHLNWQIQLPNNITELIKPYKPGIYNAFVQIDGSKPVGQEYDVNIVNWHAEQIQLVGGGILELTMEPVTEITALTDDLFTRLAIQCRQINERNGIPILLRFGHEMNGPWTQYGLKPIGYKQTFRRLANIIRTRTNVTAMLWSPNVGVAYPFNAGEGAPAPGTPDFEELDTNKDGVLNGNDDPYLPYYPGDEYVDWCGISLYWYPNLVVGGSNIAPPDTFFHDYITGTGSAVDPVAASGQYNATARNFYNVFGSLRNKPIALSESGAPYASSLQPGPGEVAIKKGWWNQILSQNTLSEFPKLKAFLNFEEQKSDEPGALVKDWAITYNPEVRAEFNRDLPAITRLTLQGTQMKYACDGRVTFSELPQRRGIHDL